MLITMDGHHCIVQHRVTIHRWFNFLSNMALVSMQQQFETTKQQQKNAKKKKKIIFRVLNIFYVNSLSTTILSSFSFSLDIQNDLGVVNNGLVYALYDYEPENSSTNELTFKDGDQLRILRRGDENESEWWWTKHETNLQEGYVPRNYLGVSFDSISTNQTKQNHFCSYFQLYPRVRPGSMASTSC